MSVMIESGVPMPEGGSRGRPNKYPFHALEIGDSLYSDSDAEVVQSAAHRYAKYHGIKIVTRRVGDNGVRVWRVA